MSAMVFVIACAAHAITLEDIGDAYARKEAALGAYSVRFEEASTFQEDNGEEVPTKDVYALTADGPRYRVEERMVEGPEDLLAYKSICVCDGTEFRNVDYNNDVAYVAKILKSRTYWNGLSLIDPIRLSGMCQEAGRLFHTHIQWMCGRLCRRPRPESSRSLSFLTANALGA